MTLEKSQQSPYVGPRPFEREERQLFFGRYKEIRNLLSLAFAHRVIILYAQSGAGKTSLLNAGMIPLLEEQDFEVLPIARVGGLIPEGVKPERIPNLYVFNSLLSCAKGDIDSLIQMSLAQFLKELPHRKNKEGLPSPRFLIFDQFEELFTLFPERWRERERFFQQVREAIDEDKFLRLLLVIREDYIAHLDSFVSLLSKAFPTRFYLERLRKDAALQAITGPLKNTNRTFAEGVAEKLVEDLMQIRVQSVTGMTVEIEGEFVEPVQLQMVCHNLWQELPTNTTIITYDHLQAFGDVDQALSVFYFKAVRSVTKIAHIRESTLRNWFEHNLITQAGTRGMAHRGPQKTSSIPNSVVDILENLHIIRGEWRAGAGWYELTHDRLIGPIQKSNHKWRRTRFRRLATLWLVLGTLSYLAGGVAFLLERPKFIYIYRYFMFLTSMFLLVAYIYMVPLFRRLLRKLFIKD